MVSTSISLIYCAIVLHFLGLYLRQQQIATSLICDNELVKCIKKYNNFDMNPITPDMTEADIILPTIPFSKQLNYNLEWHRRHIERQKEDRQQWTAQQAANIAVDELAGQAWEEEFVEIQHHQIAPHYRHSKVVQTILSDGSILGNLVHTIPEAITTLRGKPKLQEMLQMNTERMELIDKEITASNARKFVRSSIAGPLFSKQYTQQWYTDARAHYLDKRILRSRGRDRWYI